MADKRRIPPEPPPAAEPEEPPFYEALEPLVLPGGGFPVNVHLAGDHVPPADVLKFGWGNQVKVPDRFAGVLAPPPAPGEAPGPGAPTESKEE